MADDPYKDLLNSANNGSYRIVQVDSGTIQKAVQYCGIALQMVDTAVQSNTASYPDLNQSLSASQTDSLFGSLTSGKLLSYGYAKLGQNMLDTIIPAYKTALTNLGETLVVAGGLMTKADSDAGSAFDRITKADSTDLNNENAIITQSDAHATTQPAQAFGPIAYLPDQGTVPSWKSSSNSTSVLTHGLKAGGSGTTSLGVSPEPEGSLTYETALGLGKSLAGKPARLADLSEGWARMGDQMKDTFNYLSNNFSLLTKTSWQGHGADQATAAINELSGYGQQLAQNMTAVSALLTDASGWTQVVQKAMPTSGIATQNVQTTETAAANKVYGAWYIPGVSEAATVPELTPPTGIQGLDPTGTPSTQDPSTSDPSTSAPSTSAPSVPGGSSVPGSSAVSVPDTDPSSSSGSSSDGSGSSGSGSSSTAAYQKQEQQEQQQEQQQQQQEQTSSEQEQQQEQQQEQSSTEQEQQQEQSQQVEQLLQQGVQQGAQMAQQGLQQFAQQSAQANAKKLATSLENPALAGLSESALNGLGGLAGGGGAGGGVGTGLGTDSSMLSHDAQASAKLFPRASTTAALGETLTGDAKAGIASGSTGMGMPSMGGMGAAQRGGNQNEKERKRPEFLDSEEWLDEALGNAPTVAKPVVEK